MDSGEWTLYPPSHSLSLRATAYPCTASSHSISSSMEPGGTSAQPSCLSTAAMRLAILRFNLFLSTGFRRLAMTTFRSASSDHCGPGTREALGPWRWSSRCWIEIWLGKAGKVLTSDDGPSRRSARVALPMLEFTTQLPACRGSFEYRLTKTWS